MTTPTAIDSSAPVLGQHEIGIEAPLNTVWQLHVDVNSWPRWQQSMPADMPNRFAINIQSDQLAGVNAYFGELKMKTNGPAARKSFQEARQLAEERAPHLLRMIFDRWSHAAEGAGDSDEALRLARRALESVKA